MKRKAKLTYVIWLAFLPLMAWVFHTAPLSQIWDILRQLQPGQIFILVLLNGLITFLFSSRWWLILRSQGYRLQYLSVVSYRLAGFGLSYFTPGPQFGGEPLQVYLLQRRHPIPGATAVASVTLDKLLELLGNFSFLVLGVFVVLLNRMVPSLEPIRILPVVFGLLALPIGYLWGLWRGWQPITRILDLGWKWRYLRRLAPIVTAAEKQVSVFCAQKPRIVLAGMVLAGIIWGLSIFEYWVMLRYLGISMDLTQVITTLTAARLAFLLPSPSGLGTLEASQVLAFSALGFDPAQAMAVALLIRGRDTMIGLLGLWTGAALSRQTSTKPIVAGDEI